MGDIKLTLAASVVVGTSIGRALREHALPHAVKVNAPADSAGRGKESLRDEGGKG